MADGISDFVSEKLAKFRTKAIIGLAVGGIILGLSIGLGQGIAKRITQPQIQAQQIQADVLGLPSPLAILPRETHALF